ncbi:Sybindin-like protein [Kalmanozyma brasiliensis GHG001]|uniref:Trafficking protein particle complex subunit n=1 Tax=Kalmanozyma brasiliensis (strain GHG001) TaxID=1365824 RepID=V5GJF1_KALBG|nr:Sybindin-like protein [Kalmanozyma brasiliensis GHG001]EST06067.1 Sybindin-like protein [Kalmanozyma brasiliensis GHG001]
MSSLWIINKAGGLIYQSEHFVHPNAASMPNNGRLSSNEYLVLAGTLHGIHAITAKLNPVPNRKCSGIESLDSDHFTIRVMVTPTGTKFVLVTSPAHPNPAGVLHRCYEAYADHVMKNPFYTPEMPVRIETFDKAVEALVKA